MTAQQKSFNVLVVGDSCVDQYFMCRNTRLNPESSAPLVQVGSTYVKEGMSGNVALCLKNLGFKVFKLVSNNQSIKARYVNAATKEQLLRVDFDPKVDLLTISAIDAKLKVLSYDAIVIADYDKGFLDYHSINYLAARFDGPIFLDTKKKHLDKIDTSIYLKINEHEANAATSVPRNAIVTCGAAGALWYGNRWPAYKSETVDVCGAGDAFMAGLVYGYLHSLEECMEYAIVNAGLSVRHVGTYAPSIDELRLGLDDYYKQNRYGKKGLGF